MTPESTKEEAIEEIKRISDIVKGYLSEGLQSDVDQQIGKIITLIRFLPEGERDE